MILLDDLFINIFSWYKIVGYLNRYLIFVILSYFTLSGCLNFLCLRSHLIYIFRIQLINKTFQLNFTWSKMIFLLQNYLNIYIILYYLIKHFELRLSSWINDSVKRYILSKGVSYRQCYIQDAQKFLCSPKIQGNSAMKENNFCF